MKKVTLHFAFPCLAIAVIALSGSCATAPAAPAEASGLQAIAQEIRELKLAPGELWVRDVVSSAETWQATPAFAASAMLSLNEWFDFTAKLSSGQIVDLSKALFAELPKLKAPGDLRAVAVGGIYAGENPLIIIISQFRLRAGILADQDFGLDYLTNSTKFRTEDKETKALSNVGTGWMINRNVNYGRIILPRVGGHWVFSNNLNLGKYSVSGAKDPLEQANLMDTFIKDEDEANDAEIEGLYHGVRNAVGVHPMVRLTAELNWGLLLFKQGRVAEAEAHWATLSPPEGADPSAASVLNKDIPLLLGVWKAWQ